MTDVFDSIDGQRQVREFLRACLKDDRVSHAYLFAGPVGSGKRAAAHAFAQALMCGERGCGSCAACRSVAQGTHPDVHFLEPEGAAGYLIEQIRGLISDAALTPVLGAKKVYVLNHADALSASCANAFLKTLEEPPRDVVIILLGRTVDSVLPTIASRCHVIPFRTISPHEAQAIVAGRAGVTVQRARAALEACGGSLSDAESFARSNDSMELRRMTFDALSSLAHADAWDVLQRSRDLVIAAKAPLDAVKLQQETDLAQRKEYLPAASIKQIEQRNKRELTLRSRENVTRVVNLTESWLRDLLAVRSGARDEVMNTDVSAVFEALAPTVDEQSILAALKTAQRTNERIAYNVAPQASIDALLLGVRNLLFEPSDS